MDHEMNAFERKAVEKINEIFGDIFVGLPSPGGLKYADGTPVQFDLAPNKNTYLYYGHKASGARYCYTPWKDTRGWYWAFDYAPRGKGSRSGDPERLVIVNAVKFRKRKAAQKRALARFEKVGGWG